MCVCVYVYVRECLHGYWNSIIYIYVISSPISQPNTCVESPTCRFFLEGVPYIYICMYIYIYICSRTFGFAVGSIFRAAPMSKPVSQAGETTPDLVWVVAVVGHIWPNFTISPTKRNLPAYFGEGKWCCHHVPNTYPV